MNHFVVVILIGAAGAVGAITRYATTIGMSRLFGEGWLLGTLTVNVVGCFLVGMLAQVGEQYVSHQWRMVIGVGFLGALTTFSTFGLETIAKYNEGQTIMAIGHVGLNLILGLSAVVLGMYLVDALTAAE